MKFTKMNALGNDHIIVNNMDESLNSEYSDLAKDTCRRKYGIGADGLVIIEKSKKSDFKIQVFNPDGSESEMSLNGINCAAKYAFDNKITNHKLISIETVKRVVKAEIKNDKVMIDLGEPILERKSIPMLGEGEKVVNEQLMLSDRIVRITALSLDNPHCVLFVENMSEYPFKEEGKLIENHENFPKRTNVEFVHVENENEITLKVWERGVGFTLSCGTGACASCIAGVLNKKTKRKVTVHMPGGDVEVEWDEKTNHVKIISPVEYNFDGEIKR